MSEIGSAEAAAAEVAALRGRPHHPPPNCEAVPTLPTTTLAFPSPAPSPGPVK